VATVNAILPNKPLFMQAASGDTPISYDGLALRQLAGAIWPRTGILSNDAFQITQRSAGANFSVDIAPGFAVLGDTTGNANSDRYIVYANATVNVPLTGFVTNPTATRTHKVFLVVLDKQKTGLGTQYDGKVVITEDTGAGAGDPVQDGVAHFFQLGSFTIAPGAASVANTAITNSGRHAGFGPSYTNITISANIADASGTTGVGTPRVIRTGTAARLTGGFTRTSGNPFDPNTVYILGNVPNAFRPNVDRFLVAPCATPGLTHATYRLIVRTTGNLETTTPKDITAPWLGLDGVTYELD
jgi:hypothetical protein